MDSVQIIEKLICFGLTRQEATLYLCLLQSGGMTGYEAAKQTGISRSNAYNALAGLTEKGAAYIAEGTPAHYYALEPEEFCANKIRALEEMKRQISENIPKNREESEGYLTISGDAHIKDKVKNMILASKKRVYLSMAADVLSIFEKEIDEALEKGRKVVILTDKKTEKKNAVFYETEEKGKQIGVITDSTNVLTGEYGYGAESACLYTGQQNFVRVFKDSLRNEIKLIQLLKGEN